MGYRFDPDFLLFWARVPEDFSYLAHENFLKLWAVLFFKGKQCNAYLQSCFALLGGVSSSCGS